VTKSFVLGLVKTAVGLGLLAYVIAANWQPNNGGPGIRNLLFQTPDFALFAAVALLAAAAVSCQILRWYLLVRALDLPFSLRNAFRLGMVGYFYNTMLPGSIGGDFLKAYFMYREHPERRAAAVATVVVDRMLGLFGLLLFAAIFGGTFWLLGDPRVVGNDYLEKIVAVSAALVLAAVVGWIVLGFVPPARALAIEVWLRRMKWIGPALADLWGAAAMYRQRPRLLYLTIPITAFAQTLLILFLHLAVRVFPAESVGSFAEHCIIGPIGFIAQAFFPAPGGVGGAEAIFGYLYTLIGRPEQAAVIGRLTMRLAEIGLGVLGYIVYLSMRVEIPMRAELYVPETPSHPEARSPAASE
jgi:glycosyltransferase 2 family protein